MSSTIRFPRHAASVTKGPTEADQIIEILPATATFLIGGEASYVDVTAWKTAESESAPYTDVVIEFSCDEAVTIGNGTTDRIGLYGEIEGVGKFLLGVLGVNLGGTAPQIPIVAQAGLDIVGFAQVVCNVANYDKLSIGGVTADVGTGDPEVTVTARPIRRRDYTG